MSDSSHEDAPEEEEEEDDAEPSGVRVVTTGGQTFTLVRTEPSTPQPNSPLSFTTELFRYDDEKWQERGQGTLLFDDVGAEGAKKKRRILMRQRKTFKICANHTIMPSMALKAHNGHAYFGWVWQTAGDVSDGTPRHEVFAVRFETQAEAERFRAAFEEAKTWNAQRDI